jgi:hypothetical protein
MSAAWVKPTDSYWFLPLAVPVDKLTRLERNVNDPKDLPESLLAQITHWLSRKCCRDCCGHRAKRGSLPGQPHLKLGVAM